MVPSAFMISQITPPGCNPAMRARSTAASVCPARTSTPPSRARNGNTWPGRARSRGRHSGDIAIRMVCARSAAEIPVVTPSAASIDSQNAVPKRDVFIGETSGRCSASQRSGRQRQADQPAAMRRHEVDGFRRDAFGGHREIAFVLAIFIVDHDQHASGAEVFEGFRNGCERHLISG